MHGISVIRKSRPGGVVADQQHGGVVVEGMTDVPDQVAAQPVQDPVGIGVIGRESLRASGKKVPALSRASLTPSV